MKQSTNTHGNNDSGSYHNINALVHTSGHNPLVMEERMRHGGLIVPGDTTIKMNTLQGLITIPDQAENQQKIAEIITSILVIRLGTSMSSV